MDGTILSKFWICTPGYSFVMAFAQNEILFLFFEIAKKWRTHYFYTVCLYIPVYNILAIFL